MVFHSDWSWLFEGLKIKLGNPFDFAVSVVNWQSQYGRHDLPWQLARTPYSIWLSEIMLQQTQVATVKRYYDRFLEAFPTIELLAKANEDAVLALWTGLGYYNRARNLHRCAQIIVNDWAGVFPTKSNELAQLPGIGPSTAAAISSLCFSQRAVVFDGNVQRVLSRYFAFDGDLSVTKYQRQLFDLANSLLPTKEQSLTQMPIYSQGMMDLGAQICTRIQPRCDQCPVSSQCQAHRLQKEGSFPIKTRKIKRDRQDFWLLYLRREDGAVFLNKRPTTGIWAGLYSFPICQSKDEWKSLAKQWHCTTVLPTKKHVLTHRDLSLHLACGYYLSFSQAEFIEQSISGQWITPLKWKELGLAAPICRWLNSLATVA